MPNEIDWNALLSEAKRVRQNAYAPYSRFQVGAAVLTESGAIYAGCNVENASFGGTICAERNAITTAIAAGEDSILALALFTDTDAPTPPCGMCRQVMFEFGRGTVVRSYGANAQFIETTTEALLPAAFDSDAFMNPNKR
ncbi:MAG: cytidine deaminase [Polyangiales bacterium]